jgi:hypothetical protein
MKNLIYLMSLTILLATQAHAEVWSKILVCEDGTAVVDVNASDRTNIQLVLRGDDLLGRLYRADMINLKYGQQEFLLRGVHAELRQSTPTATLPVSLGGVFYPQDFKKMIWQDWNGSAVEVEVRGSELAIKKLHYTDGTSCTGSFEGECQGAVHHRTYYFDREFVLRGCGYAD